MKRVFVDTVEGPTHGVSIGITSLCKILNLFSVSLTSLLPVNGIFICFLPESKTRTGNAVTLLDLFWLFDSCLACSILSIRFQFRLPCSSH